MPQTPKRPPRNACGRSDNDLRRCLFFLFHSGSGTHGFPTPFTFRTCRVPAARPGLQNPARVGQHHGGMPFPSEHDCAIPLTDGAPSPRFRPPPAASRWQPSWGRGRQVMHLLCKQDHVGALPIVSTSFGPVTV